MDDAQQQREQLQITNTNHWVQFEENETDNTDGSVVDSF